jgi:hypothetical protein
LKVIGELFSDLYCMAAIMAPTASEERTYSIG